MTTGLVHRCGHALVRHRWWTAAAVVVLAAGGTALFFATRGSGDASAAITYRVVQASTGTVRQSVQTTGTLEPAQQASLSFQVSGQVTSVRVAVGDTVQKGAVLATVDSAALRADLAQAKASLANAQAALAAAEDSGASDAQQSADTAAVTAARQAVSSARQSLADAHLVSPIAGQVASVTLTKGEQVSGTGSGQGSQQGGQGGANASSSSSDAQVVVVGTTSWTVDATVDATEVGLIAKGDQAQLVIDGATSTVYGTISSVGVVASTGSSGSSSSGTSGSSSSSAAYPVEIAVTGNPSGLHAGATGTVSLIYRQLSNVLTVPSLAVHEVNGASVVYVSSDGTASGTRTAKRVTTGLSSDGDVQITSGLVAGDPVLVQVAVRTGTGTGTGSGTTSGTGRRFGGGLGGGFGGGGFGGGGLGGGLGGAGTGGSLNGSGTGGGSGSGGTGAPAGGSAASGGGNR